MRLRQACNELTCGKSAHALLLHACMHVYCHKSGCNSSWLQSSEGLSCSCTGCTSSRRTRYRSQHLPPRPVVRRLRRDDLTLPQPRCTLGKGAAPCVCEEGKSRRRHPRESSRLTLFRVKVRHTACHPLTNNRRAKEEDGRESNHKTNEVRC